MDLFANFCVAIQIAETQQLESIYKNEQLIYGLLRLHFVQVFLTAVLQ